MRLAVIVADCERRLGEGVGTEGSHRRGDIVIAGDFGAEGGDDFAAGDGGHSNRPVAEHRVLFLFQAAVVREELVQRGVEQTDRLADAFLNTFANALLKSRGAVPFSPPLFIYRIYPFAISANRFPSSYAFSKSTGNCSSRYFARFCSTPSSMS